MKKSDRKLKRKIGALGVLGILLLISLIPISYAAPIWGTDVEDDDSYYISIDDDGDPDDDQAFAVSKHGKPGVGTELLRLEETGRLGIGDTSPDFKLEVTGSSGDGYFGVSSTDDEGDNGDIFIIDSNGNVGIETASPGAKLDVELISGGAAEIGDSQCTATGNYAVAMGSDTEATGACAVAMGGTETYARGACSLAVGIIAETGTDAAYSFAIGCAVEANGYCSGVMGTWANAEADRSFVIGGGIDVETILTNNVEESLMVGFDSTTPTLFVDGSSVGIGTTGPDGKLDILSTSGPQLRLSYTDGSVYTDLQTTDDGFLYINPSQNRVGIETIDPASTLSVAGGVTIGSTWASSYAASAGELLVQNNVGIGVTNPAEKLEIDGNVLFNFGSDREIKIEDPPSQTTSDGKDLTVRAGNANLAYGGITDHDGGNLYLYGGNGEGVQSAYGGDVYIYGGTSESEWPHDGDVILAHSDQLARGRVGIGTTTPVTTLDVNGGLATEITKTVDHDVTSSDFTILADAGSNDIDIKLPSVEGIQGRILVIKKIDETGNSVFVIPEEGQQIDGEDKWELNNQYDSIMIQAYESDWWII